MAYVRIDNGAMSHPKILGLSDKAFRLWVWGLCYSQMHLTDGYIPLAALPPRLKAAVPMLMAPYPILWEVSERQDGGFQVHDYGDWNDVKAVVVKNRQAAKDRMQKRRASDPPPPDGSVENMSDVRSGTFAPNVLVGRSVTSSGSSVSEKGSGEKPARTGSGVLSGALPRDHMRHAICGRVCLHETQFEQFVKKLGGDKSADRVRDWANALMVIWGEHGDKRNITIQGNNFAWWDARWTEWQGSPKAAAGSPSLVPRQDWTCHHEPPCAPGTSAFRCDQRTQLESGRAAS